MIDSRTTDVAERETSAEIDAAATLWAVRASDGGFGTDGEAELRAWVGADARRLGAYTRARAVLAQANRARALGPDFDPDRYASQHSQLPEHSVVDTALLVRTSRRRFLIGGSAAAAATAGIAMGVSWPAAATTYSTKRGEIRLIPLPDGSSMTLNTESTAKALFTSKERHVELVEGEALFVVVNNPVCPFVVQAGRSRLHAGTTSFSVSRLRDQEVRITVRQGSLLLAGIGTNRGDAMLTANTRAVVASDSANVATVPVSATEVNRQLVWQQGMLSFEDTPLEQAAAQFSRYSDTAILFDDPAIRQETITGLYAANNPRGFARSAAMSLGLRASEGPDAVTLGRQSK